MDNEDKLVYELIDYKAKTDHFEVLDQYDDINDFIYEVKDNFKDKKYIKDIIKDLNYDIYSFSSDTAVYDLYCEAKMLREKLYKHLKKMNELELS